LRHRSVQAAVAKLPAADIPLFGKGDVSQGIVTSKGDDWQFKEGSTAVVALGGAKKAVVASASAGAKVKGGAAAKRAGKAASKASDAKKAAVKAKLPATTKVVEKVIKYTPSKGSDVKAKGKKSVTAKKATSPAAAKSQTGTTD